jgi:hypothetical protein
MVGKQTANGHIIVPNDVFVSLPCRCVLSTRGGLPQVGGTQHP